MAPLAAEIGKRFESLHPGVRVDVQSGGSGRGVIDVRQGLADIGLVSRELKDDEQDLLPFPIALDGVCMILHRQNPVAAIDDDRVAAIYSGRITNWKEIGGKDAPIVVVNKADGRSTLELFCRHYGLKPADIRAHVVIGDNPQGIKTVAGHPDSIGYVSIGTAEYEAGHGSAIKLLPCSGVAASTENVKNGSFPLSRPLIFATRERPEGLAKEFIRFAQSDKVHDLFREHCFVPIPR
jgi:phosphate transport system substrate-binding protein